jgi:bacterioferritin-associated ferredoxin
MYVCLCKGITDSRVRELADSGLVGQDALASRLGINEESCCGRCLRDIQSLVVFASSGKSVMEIQLFGKDKDSIVALGGSCKHP